MNVQLKEPNSPHAHRIDHMALLEFLDLKKNPWGIILSIIEDVAMQTYQDYKILQAVMEEEGTASYIKEI